MKKIEPFIFVCTFSFTLQKGFVQQVVDALPTGISDKLALAPRYDGKMRVTYSQNIMIDKKKREITSDFLFSKEWAVRNKFFSRLSHVKGAMSELTQEIEVKYTHCNIPISNKKVKTTKK